jgi:hypothetical protein
MKSFKLRRRFAISPGIQLHLVCNAKAPNARINLAARAAFRIMRQSDDESHPIAAQVE